MRLHEACHAPRPSSTAAAPVGRYLEATCDDSSANVCI